jgi:hypothetical protein
VQDVPAWKTSIQHLETCTSNPDTESIVGTWWTHFTQFIILHGHPCWYRWGASNGTLLKVAHNWANLCL